MHKLKISACPNHKKVDNNLIFKGKKSDNVIAVYRHLQTVFSIN